ncbi:MAG: pilus assembly protein TadG-related protein [Planctomycetota bacterium]
MTHELAVSAEVPVDYGVPCSRQRGSALIWVAVCLFLIVGLGAFAVDFTHVYAVRSVLQTTADAAATAGALRLPSESEARAAAMDYAQKNLPLSENGAVLLDADIVIGHWDTVSHSLLAGGSPTNALQVTARRASANGNPVSPIFARIFGFAALDVAATATALNEGGAGSGIIVLSPLGSCTLDLNGNFTLDLNDSALQVNSSDPRAACGNGVVVVDTPSLNVSGDPGVDFTPGVEVTGEVHAKSPPIPDPLASLAAPSWSPSADRGGVVVKKKDRVTLDPGYYSGGITQTGGILELRPGIYVLDGAGLNLSGNGSFVANGVLLYVKGTGTIDMTGNSTTIITPIDPEVSNDPAASLYAGISLFQERASTTGARVIGTSQLRVSGVLYLPAAELEVGGTADTLGNQLLVWTMRCRGTGTLTVDYQEGGPVTVSRTARLVQ